MKELIASDDYLPVPFPNEDVQKVREWLNRVIPLSSCQKFVEKITDVRYDCGPDAPAWVRALAKEAASPPLRPIDIQVLCYNAMIQQPIHKAMEPIFEITFETSDALEDATHRFNKGIGLFFRWRLDHAARSLEEFQQDPAAGRAALSRVWFEVITDELLFKN